MTGEERLEFKELREDLRVLRNEMLAGFRDVTSALGIVANRVGSLEMTRSKEEGAQEARKEERAASEKALERGRNAFMWKVGTIVTVASIITSLLLRATGIIF